MTSKVQMDVTGDDVNYFVDAEINEWGRGSKDGDTPE